MEMKPKLEEWCYFIMLWKTMFRPPKQSSTTEGERGILLSLVRLIYS